jgi:hypothetical protein
MHIHLFEFTDQGWYPRILRQYMTDYLHFVITKAGIYKPAIPILKDIISKTGIDEIIDLCSGSGGGVDELQDELSEQCGKIIKVTLSDKYPNIEPYELLKNKSNGGLNYIKEPIDAMHVPSQCKGIRTMFSAFHHFKPGDAKNIINDAVTNKTPICIFEGAGKTVIDFIGILIFTPIIFFFTTPFIKPFSISRVILTYIIPVVPVTTLWDGLVSILRMYTPGDMLIMAKEASGENYEWKAGQIKGKLGNRVMYLAGYYSKKL